MRSRKKEYIITKDEVHGYANEWLAIAVRCEYEGRKCTTRVLLQILLIAASRVVSVFAACRDLADAPTNVTIFNALYATLPEIRELERRLNRALVTKVPRSLRRKARMLAMDLTLIPYHGEPAQDKKEIYRSKPKAGTSHFHAYATAAVVHKGYRYTVALTRVEYGEAMNDVLQRLLAIVRRRGVKIKFLLLDKGFYSVRVMTYLKRAGHGFIIPVVLHGKKKKAGCKVPPTGMRALLKKKNGYYRQTIEGKDGKKKVTTEVNVCVASKQYVKESTGKKCRKKLLYAIWKVRRTPQEIRELYRKRFGIETTYRQMNEARIKTCARDPRVRLLFVAIALVLRNVWVWIHFRLAKNKHAEEPRLFLEILRFEEMLLWITEVIQQALGAHKTKGVDYHTYQRLTSRA